MKNGIFIISLDFELFWGIFEKTSISDKKNYFDNTLKTIPKILKLFEKYKIEATWASVGFLFFNDLEQLKKHYPKKIPDYLNKQVSSYEYIKKRYKNKFNKYHFAPDLIQLIHQTKGQEVASHTLSHYYCLEPGQTPETFYFDLLENIKIAKQYNIKLKSLVFPRNQYNPSYENIVEQSGITTIRSNPDIWFWDANKKENILKKIFRTTDAYFPLFKSTYLLTDKKLPLKIPASRFLRPLSKYTLLNKLRIKRIKNEMNDAAKNKKIYHLWWHPHNFGNQPANALEELEEILQHFQYLQKQYGFTSMNMNNIYKYFTNHTSLN
jgi:peptidoglycan/xylan/chitin deacetylase (PgdA/CDA1 family)